jgi:hypothetical protein
MFTLREMTLSDGPALKRLMENDPVTPGMSLTTRFLVDPYQAWRALQPTMIGVVAEAPGGEELAGVATVAFDDTHPRRPLPMARRKSESPSCLSRQDWVPQCSGALIMRERLVTRGI